MAARTAWTAGNGVGYTWTTLINSADLVSMAAGSTVVSSVADIANQTNQDIYMDVSVRLAIASTAITAGANAALFLFALLDDGATYGDGNFVNGTQKAATPAFAPIAVIPFPVATLTALVGYAQGLIIPPGSFRFALQNNTLPATALSAGTQTVKYRTYNMNLNN
jgi:hypothetical protein